MGFEILSLGSSAANQPSSLLRLGQRTRLRGKAGVFVVVGLDEDSQTADLIASSGISPVLQGIPFDDMRPTLPPAAGFDDRILPFPS